MEENCIDFCNKRCCIAIQCLACSFKVLQFSCHAELLIKGWSVLISFLTMSNKKIFILNDLSA